MAEIETILQLRVERIIIYYDLPQLFVAVDQIDAKYLCLLIESETDYVEYIGIPISQTKLNNLILGKIDLRSAFQSSENGVWYFITSDDDGEFISKPVNFQVVDEKYLPEPGFIFPQVDTDDELIISESIEKNNAIVHLSFVDQENSNSINVDIFSDFMKLYQNLVKYVYKKATSSYNNRPDIEDERNYLLRAFATSPGSFNVHLASTGVQNLFGSSYTEWALERIDKIITDIENPTDVLENIRINKGHAISAYKKILENIVKYNITVTYKWVSPSDKIVRRKRINKDYARLAIDLIKDKEELSREIKTFIGTVKEIDVDSGKWRILNEDGKSYSGKSGGIALSGITVDDDIYVFECEEIIEMDKAGTKEVTTYSLQKWEKKV